ncbi:hypothetical protein V8F33_011097 [Rhypophila sp. PSN 637]
MTAATTPRALAPAGVSAKDDRTMIRESLGAALDAIEFTGSFAAFTKTKSCSVKPIFVDDVGFIEFSLPEATARALIDKARQAPNGKGETFVNTSVSGNALRWVAKSLGIPASIQIKAELYKMLVYGKEAIVKAQTQTEQIPNVFGTFIMCLPSVHQGGDLVLKHRSNTKVFKTSHTRPSWACWFSDVSHEVLPVESGLRIVLTYDLLISDRTDETLDELTSEEDLTRDSGISEVSISTGSDAFRTHAAPKNATVFLRILKKLEHGQCRSRHESQDSFQYWEDDLGDGEDDENWHEFVEVGEMELTIKNIVSIDGKLSYHEVYIDEEDLQSKLIQYDEGSDPFTGAHYAKEDGYDDWEHEYASATHCYSNGPIVVPNDLLDVFLTPNLSSHQAQSRLPKYLARCCENDPQTRQSAMSMVRHLAEAAWSSCYDTSSLKGRDAKTLMEVVNVVLQALSAIPVAQRMEQLKAWGLDSNPNDVVINPQIRKWAFDEVVIPAISACVPGPGAAEHPSAKDGAAIVSMVHSYGDFEYLKAHLLPIIREQISNIPFSLASLTQIILLSRHDGVFPTLETSKICYPNLNAALANMDVSKLQSQEASDATLAAGRPSSRRIVSPRLLADLLIICLRFKWNTLALEFCGKVVGYLSSAPTVHRSRAPFWRVLRLNGFLASKDRVWHFQAVLKDRQHIEEKVSSRFSLTFETIQNMEFAWTLVLTKEKNSAEKLRAAWNKKFKAAQKILGDLSKSELKQVVGGEKE